MSQKTLDIMVKVAPRNQHQVTSSSIQAEISWFLLVDMPIHAICPVFCGRKVQCFDDVIGSSLQDGSTCCQPQWLLTTLRIDLTLH